MAIRRTNGGTTTTNNVTSSATQGVSQSGITTAAPGSVILTLRCQDTNNTLQGATFQLQVYIDDEWTDVVGSTHTTNASGQITVPLNNGTYRFVQTSVSNDLLYTLNNPNHNSYYDGLNVPISYEFTINIADEVGEMVTVYNALNTHIVTFDLQGGTPYLPLQTVFHGGTAGEPVDDPTREGYIFTGWFTESTDGDLFDFDALITEDTTIYAHWTPIEIVPVTVTVTFNGNGGAPAMQTRTVNVGSYVGGAMPTVTRDGYTFISWSVGSPNGTQFHANTVVNEDITVYAVWIPATVIPNEVIVTFNGNGGAPATQMRWVELFTTVGVANMPPEPTRSGYAFMGWFTEITGGTQFLGTTVVVQNITVYARWIPVPIIPTDVTVIFNGNGGTPATQTRSVAPNTAIGTANMPPVPTRSGYTFVGWFTEITGGTQFLGTTLVVQNITVYARWTAIPAPTPDPTPEFIKTPDRTTARAGETINWTLRGFHNRTGGAVSNFSVVDIPGQGLNFQSATIPAFSNSAGVTYEIRYTIAGSNTWHVYRSEIDASRPFNFSLPQSGSQHYTNIMLFFGDVPANFGLGNEIVMTFVVGDNAPNNELVNRFIVRHSNVELEGGSPERPTVSPPATSTPQTPQECDSDQNPPNNNQNDGTNNVSDGNDVTEKAPQTSASMSIVLWISLAILSLCGVAFAVKWHRVEVV
jgi:uncharacterized repeat protein (TIGR02543 family)/uncharacterized repeat protein (TIGR01451 family)